MNFFDTQLELQPVEGFQLPKKEPAITKINRNDSTKSIISHQTINAFNTSLLTTRAKSILDQNDTLKELMASSEFKFLLSAAEQLSKEESITLEEATERLIVMFRKMDAIWTDIVLKRGLQNLIND